MTAANEPPELTWDAIASQFPTDDAERLYRFGIRILGYPPSWITSYGEFVALWWGCFKQRGFENVG